MELKEVFEPVLNFIKNLQKKDKEAASKQAAKDRLKLVLMQDRASVSPDFFEMMKKEIIDVIKKYIEIDEESLEVQLTRGLEAGLEGPALYANIPIKNVKPVAPQNENEEDESIIEEKMTEEKAEEVAEQILNKIEEAASEKNIENIDEKIKEIIEQETSSNNNENVDIKEIDKKEIVENKEEKKSVSKKTTKTTEKSKAKTKTAATKKTTTSKTKKDSKK